MEQAEFELSLDTGWMNGSATHTPIMIRKVMKNRPKAVSDQFGGPCRDRTDDLLHAMEALSQLS